MRVFPQFPGPMAHWPQVEATPGVAEALAALHRRYRLALVTNAADSGEALVRAALRRVELEGHFDVVLTARELGVRKPDPSFFILAARVLGCEPHQGVMIGDDYDADVVGATRAGLRAIWYNPAGVSAPPILPPASAQIRRMSELEAAIDWLAAG